MKKIKFLTRGFVFIFGLSSATNTFAYSLSAAYLLGKMIKGHERIHSLELEGKVTDLKNAVSFHESTHIDYASGKINSTETNEAGEVLSEKFSKLAESRPLGLAWYSLPFASGMSQVQGVLANLGIVVKDDTKVGLTRIQMRPVFQIGEAAKLKIDKTDFSFSGFQNESKDSFEVETFSTSGNVRLPKKIIFKKMDVPVYSYELKSFKVNGPVKNNQKSGGIRAVSSAIQGWNELVH